MEDAAGSKPASYRRQPFPHLTPGSSQPFPLGEGHVASLALQPTSNPCSKRLIRKEKSIEATLEASRDCSQPVPSCLYIQDFSGNTFHGCSIQQDRCNSLVYPPLHAWPLLKPWPVLH